MLTAAHCVVGTPASNIRLASGITKLTDITSADRRNIVAKGGRTDYEQARGTLTIPAGTRSGTIDVVIISDLVPEPLESFSVTLSNARIARLGRATAAGWITDND